MNAHDTILGPDLKQIRAHLEAWAAPYRGTEYEDGLVEIAFTPPGNPAVNRARLFGLDEIEAAAAFAAEKNAQQSNLYVGVALRSPDADRQRRASGLDFYAAAFAAAEADEDAERVAARIEALGTKGAIRVLTGRKPTQRVHHWLRLRELCDDPEDHGAATAALVAHLGADAKVKDSARVLRLGGTVNWILDPSKRTKGYVDELTAVRIGDAAPVDLDRLAALDPLPGWSPKQTGGGGGNGGPGEIAHNAEGKVTDGREAFWRQILMIELGSYQRDHGADPTAEDLFAAAFARFEAETVGDDRWTSERGQRELAKRVQNTLRRLRSGHLARFGLASVETGANAEEAKRVQAERDARFSGNVHIGGGQEGENAAAEWPEPDALLLRPELPPAPPLDLGAVLKPRLARWIEDAAQSKGAPTDYVFLSVLSVVGATIGNTRWAGIWPGWSEPPLIWGMCIGLPSASKSPAIDAAVHPLRKAERPLREAAEAARAEWAERLELAKLAEATWKDAARAALKEGKTPPSRPEGCDAGEPPHIPRLVVNDGTIERLGAILARQPRGTLQMRDELAGWLEGMQRYSGGGSDRPFWLEAFGGRGFTVERMGREPLTIDRLTIGVLGGIQPDRLKSLFVKADDDGLLARFLPVWPEPAPLCRPRAQADAGLMDRALSRLLTLDLVTDHGDDLRPWIVPFSDDARDLMDAFRLAVREWEGEASGLLLSFIGKLPGYAARLALVLAFLDWATEGGDAPIEIAVDHFGRAAHLVEAYFLPMARRSYADAAAPKAVRAARQIVGLIRANGWERFSSRDVMRSGRANLTTATEVNPALAVLEEGDCIRAVDQPAGPKGGRPPREYLVNPAILGGDQ